MSVIAYSDRIELAKAVAAATATILTNVPMVTDRSDVAASIATALYNSLAARIGDPTANAYQG